MSLETLEDPQNNDDMYQGNRVTDPQLSKLVDHLGALAMEQDAETLGKLLSEDNRYLQIINSICSNHGTPLVLAAYTGNVPCMEILVRHGADVNGFCALGTTPLFTAAQEGHLDACEWLLDNGADVELTNKGEELITALHTAAFHGHADVVDLLVRYGADPARPKRGGATALFLAAQEGHLEVVRRLVERHGQDPAAPRDDGKTPLFIAAQGGHLPVVEYLVVDAGAPIRACTDAMLTPLHAAAMFGHGDVCDFLCQVVPRDVRPLLVNAETADGYSAMELREAHIAEPTDSVRPVLLRHGAQDRESVRERHKVLPESYQPAVLMREIVIGVQTDNAEPVSAPAPADHDIEAPEVSPAGGPYPDDYGDRNPPLSADYYPQSYNDAGDNVGYEQGVQGQDDQNELFYAAQAMNDE